MPTWLQLLTILLVAVYLVLLLAASGADLVRRAYRLWDQRLRSPVVEFLDDHLFRTSCFLLLVACLIVVGQQIAAGKTDLPSLAALILSILVLALGCQYGQIFFSRVKKLGPLEFFELKAPELLELLDEVFREFDTRRDGEPLSTEDRYVIERADLYLAVAELQPTEAWSKSSKRRFGDRVYKVGCLALKLENWPMARSRLSWYCRLLTELKDEVPAKVHYNLGLANAEGLKSSGSMKDEKLRKALCCFAEASRKDPWDYQAFFEMACVEDELNMLELAIEDYDKALKLHDGYAPAKFNIAISRIKKREFEHALGNLRKISTSDEEGKKILLSALTYPDLQDLLNDPQWGGPAREFLAPYSTS
jgi:tetratricopeptide (TPR) repeat protein